MSKILVTGGAGFIGSNFVRYWHQQHPEDSIVNLDALTYAGHLENLHGIKEGENYHFVHGNILDKELVHRVIHDVDTVVHFAAESHVDRSILGPEAFVETNVKGTFLLLEAVRELQGKKNIHFHHISTDEVFGTLPLDSTTKFTEETPYQPNSPYSASKAGSDHLVRAYHETYKVPVTITNCSNNFGPYQHPEKFISRMITNLLDDQPVKIYGDGLYVRDWLHVQDHCRAIEAVLQRGKVGETYLVGGMSDEVNNLEVANMVIEYVRSSTSTADDSPNWRVEFVKDRAGHDRRYAIDWTKINRDLGWEPQHTFEEWLQKTVDWYQENESWWRPLKEEAEAIYKKTGQ